MRLLSLLLLLVLTAPSPALAVEEFPSSRRPDPSVAGALRDYQTKSRDALKRLGEIVDKTEKGEEHLRNEWEVISASALAHLDKLGADRKVPEWLADWHAAEIEAWTNVRRIGADMIDMHYQLASTIEDIEADIKVSQAFSKKWQERAGKLDGDVGDLGAIFDGLDALTDDFGAAKELAGEAGKILNVVEYATRTLTRLYNTYKFRKEKFVNEKKLLADYKRSLEKLRDFDIDPDEKGLFLAAERRWEERMFNTHRRYLDAVKDWNKANEWIGAGKLTDFLKKAMPILLSEITKKTVFEQYGPLVPVSDINNLEKRAWQLRSAFYTIMEKWKNTTWERLERELTSTKEDITLLGERRKMRLAKVDQEAGQRALDAIDEIREQLEDLSAQEQDLLRRLGKVKSDRESNSINAELDRIKADESAAYKELNKRRDYYEIEWKRIERQKIEEEYERAVGKLQKMLDDLEAKKSKA